MIHSPETLPPSHRGRFYLQFLWYFLVFQDKDISMTGAYPMSEFLMILAEL
ncbi:MAG: hypothetical protein IJ498_01415 [Akkermansia sp.]|nr:hypothetical protein [Akkermansia sp.]